MGEVESPEAEYLRLNPDVADAVRRKVFSSGWEHFERYGRSEGRIYRAPGDLTREEKLFEGLDRAGLGLEIGPSYNPVAPKKRGFNVHVLDHLDAPHLRIKYAPYESMGVDISNIEEVDFVCPGLSLVDTIGRQSCYDWIIASHVIEHVPDVVSFLQQCERLLKPAGSLSLAIPDKRYCFDHLNSATPTGAILDAFAEKRTMPAPGQVFDHYANACRRGGVPVWNKGHAGDLSLIHSFIQAQDFWAHATSAAGYRDVHCWRFTPRSFQLVLSDLKQLGLTELGVAHSLPTAGCEFFVRLERMPASDATLDRVAALQEIQQGD